MLHRVRALLADVRWLYPRPLTTVAVLGMGLLSALVVHALLPAGWRPGLGWVLLAVPVTYVVHRLGSHTGLSKRFKHSLLDELGGDVDDAQTWLIAGLTAGGVLLVVAGLERAVG